MTSGMVALDASYRSDAFLGAVKCEHRMYTVNVSFDGAPARLLARVIINQQNEIVAVRALRLVKENGQGIIVVDSVYRKPQP